MHLLTPEHLDSVSGANIQYEMTLRLTEGSTLFALEDDSSIFFGQTAFQLNGVSYPGVFSENGEMLEGVLLKASTLDSGVAYHYAIDNYY